MPAASVCVWHCQAGLEQTWTNFKIDFALAHQGFQESDAGHIQSSWLPIYKCHLQQHQTGKHHDHRQFSHSLLLPTNPPSPVSPPLTSASAAKTPKQQWKSLLTTKKSRCSKSRELRSKQSDLAENAPVNAPTPTPTTAAPVTLDAVETEVYACQMQLLLAVAPPLHLHCTQMPSNSNSFSLTTSHLSYRIAFSVRWHHLHIDLFPNTITLPTDTHLRPTVYLSKPVFDSIWLGSDQNVFKVQLLQFPPSDGQLLEKVQAFAYFEEIIHQHCSQLTSSAIQQAYAAYIHVSSSTSASEEANRISRQLSDAFFQVANLSCLSFFKSDGTEASVAFDPCDRTSDITSIQFKMAVAPATFSSVLINTPLSIINYFLKFPQSMPPPMHYARVYVFLSWVLMNIMN